MSTATTILLIRHAHSTMTGRFCGHLDAPLSEAGTRQLPEITRYAERWPIAKVYTSDLKRAYDTAAAIAGPRSLPLLPRKGLREISFGDWEGRSWAEIEAKCPEQASLWLRNYPQRPAPGGESLAQFRARIESELAVILNESSEDWVAIVTHAGVIRVAVAKALGIGESSMHKIEIACGGITILRREHQDWFLEGVNLGVLPPESEHQPDSESKSANSPPLRTGGPG